MSYPSVADLRRHPQVGADGVGKGTRLTDDECSRALDVAVELVEDYCRRSFAIETPASIFSVVLGMAVQEAGAIYSSTPTRASSVIDERGTTTFATPRPDLGRPTGVPEWDAKLNAFSDRHPAAY